MDTKNFDEIRRIITRLESMLETDENISQHDAINILQAMECLQDVQGHKETDSQLADHSNGNNA